MPRQRAVEAILVLVLLFWRANSAVAQDSGGRPRNIILIGWDGVQRNHLKESLRRGELPNLEKLSAQGALVAIDILRTTSTKPGYAQLLTGYEPETTGVFDNQRYQPIPKGYTIFERLEKFFGPDKFISAAVLAKKEELFGQGLDEITSGLYEDAKVGQGALELLDKHKDKPFFFLIFFGQTDFKGHAFGENSKEYNAALISADAWLGKIVRKLKDLGIYDQTLIYVTSDHGFDEGQKTHYDAPYIFLATNDPKVIRRGRRQDIAPTILSRFGLDLDTVQPPLDGHPLTQTYTEPKW